MADFMNYYKFIISALDEMGFEVKYLKIYQGEGTYCEKFFHKKNNNIERYYNEKLLELEDSNFDYVLVFRGEDVPNGFFEKLFKKNKSSLNVLYLWDSLENDNQTFRRLDLFDKVFTFDPYDAKKYDLKFRPLFYVKNYEVQRTDVVNKPAFMFVGTDHNDRFNILEDISAWCVANGYPFFFYLLANEGKLRFFLNRIRKNNYKKSSNIIYSWKILSSREIQQKLDDYGVVIDIERPKQNGLTIRTIETIASGKKLLTTNTDIRNYSFYDPNRIMILDREAPKVNEDFLLADSVFDYDGFSTQYSLISFLKEVLGLGKKEVSNYYKEVKTND